MGLIFKLRRQTRRKVIDPLSEGIGIAVDAAYAFLEDIGFVAQFSVGANRKRGDLRFRYGYHYVERLASIADFANNAYGRRPPTNLKGHDLRLTYSLGKHWTVTARASLMDSIEPTPLGRVETERYRIDFDYKIGL